MLVLEVSWALGDAAHDLPAGRVSAAQREELADTLQALGFIVRASAPAEAAPARGVSLRCGRSVPALHLVEADDTVTQQSYWSTRAKVAMCGVELTDETPVPDFDEECPGCVDCSRYCSKCVRTAAGRIGS